ncbi:MAG: hypothetical protein HYY64_17525 [Candidatus Rokubacteria bacterium]|nr:hypothetical protein [Candidatus Rokubacteria bacterium]
MTLRAALAVALTSLLLPGLTGAQTPAPSPAECRAVRDRIGEHARVSAAARSALGMTAPAAPEAAPDPAARAETVRARLAQIKEERERLEDEKVGAIVKLDFSRMARIQERIEGLEVERRGLEAELAGLEQARRQVRPGLSWMAPLGGTTTGLDLARVPCRDLPSLEDKALRARRKELGGAEGQAALVPLLPLRGQTDRELAAELSAQLGPDPEVARRLGLLDQDGDTQVDGVVDSPAPGALRLFRQRSDGSLALDLFLAAVPPDPDAPYGEAARRLEEALLRQTRRQLADLLPLRPVGPVKVLGETGEFSRLRALLDSGRFDQVIQAGNLAGRSLEFQNYRGETVRLLEVVAGDGQTAQLRTSATLVKPDGEEQREETVMRFRPVSFWRTDVEVDQGREVKPAPGGAAQPWSAAPTLRFSLER